MTGQLFTDDNSVLGVAEICGILERIAWQPSSKAIRLTGDERNACKYAANMLADDYPSVEEALQRAIVDLAPGDTLAITISRETAS